MGRSLHSWERDVLRPLPVCWALLALFLAVPGIWNSQSVVYFNHGIWRGRDLASLAGSFVGRTGPKILGLMPSKQFAGDILVLNCSAIWSSGVWRRWEAVLRNKPENSAICILGWPHRKHLWVHHDSMIYAETLQRRLQEITLSWILLWNFGDHEYA